MSINVALTHNCV